jgi:hypothetical protein
MLAHVSALVFVHASHPERCFLRWQWPHQPAEIFPHALPAGEGAAAAADAAQQQARHQDGEAIQSTKNTEKHREYF